MLPPHLPGRTYDPTSDYRNDPQSPKFNRTAATETNGIPQDILDRYKYNPFNDPINTELLHLHNSPLAGAANVNVAPVKSSTAAGGGSSGGSGHNAGTGGGGNNNSSGNGGDGNTAGQWGSGGGSSGTSTAWGGSSGNSGGSSSKPSATRPSPSQQYYQATQSTPTPLQQWNSANGTSNKPAKGPGSSVPIVLDLAGNGIKITPLTSSNHWLDAAGDGHQHRTAWAGAGNAVLFFDPNGLNKIAQNNQYIFTEWDPTAKSDLDALRSVFDTNHDGVLNASDAGFSNFKLEVTNADGSTSIQTLAQAGIPSINLTADLTDIVQPDGSRITGQTTFTRTNESTGTVANAAFVSENDGYVLTQSVTTDGSGNRVVDSKAFGADGALVKESRAGGRRCRCHQF